MHGHLEKPVHVLYSRAVLWIFTGTGRRHLLSKKVLKALAGSSRDVGRQRRVKKPGVIFKVSHHWWGMHADQPTRMPGRVGVGWQNTSLKKVCLVSPFSLLLSKRQVRLELREQERSSTTLDMIIKFRFRLKYLIQKF